MGSKCSKHNDQCVANDKVRNGCSDEICNCFLHDSQVKCKPVVSLSSQKWLWTRDHEAALQESLLKNYQISVDIARTLRLFAYAVDHSFYVPAYRIRQERVHSSSVGLLKKALCPIWYASHFSNCPTLDVAVVNPDQTYLTSLSASLRHSCCPALQRDCGGDEGIRRVTMFADSCLFTVNARFVVSANAVTNSPHICIVLIRDEQDVENLGHLSLLSQHVIVVQCNSSSTTKKGYAAIRQFCNRYNICYYKADSSLADLSDDDDGDGDDDNGKAQQLFALAIKHYWFKHSGVP